MSTNNHGQSDIVTHTTNSWNKEYPYCYKRTFLYANVVVEQLNEYQQDAKNVSSAMFHSW